MSLKHQVDIISFKDVFYSFFIFNRFYIHCSTFAKIFDFIWTFSHCSLSSP